MDEVTASKHQRVIGMVDDAVVPWVNGRSAPFTRVDDHKTLTYRERHDIVTMALEFHHRMKRRTEPYGHISVDALVKQGGQFKFDGLVHGHGAPDKDGLIKLCGIISPQLKIAEMLAESEAAPTNKDSFRGKMIKRVFGGGNQFQGKINRSVAVVIAAMGILTVGYAAEHHFSILSRVWSIAASHGAQEAYESLENADRDSANVIYGLAHTAYLNGRYQDALGHLDQLEALNDEPNRPRASYLRGSIHSQLWNLDAAIEHHKDAHDRYERAGDPKTVTRLRLMLAKTYARKGEIQNARYYLNLVTQPEPLDPHGQNLMLYTESIIAYRESDYDSALAFALKRLEPGNSPEGIEMLAEINSDIGYYSALTGEYDEARVYTRFAASLAREARNPNLGHYNALNMLVIYKCQGGEYEIHRGRMQWIAEQNNDQQMKNLIYDIDKFSCPVIRPGSGGTDPPPPPPGGGDPPPSTISAKKGEKN